MSAMSAIRLPSVRMSAERHPCAVRPRARCRQAPRSLLVVEGVLEAPILPAESPTLRNALRQTCTVPGRRLSGFRGCNSCQTPVPGRQASQ